jgi:hypothetical protein
VARLVNELRPALRIEDAFETTFALERSSRPPLGRLLELVARSRCRSLTAAERDRLA